MVFIYRILWFPIRTIKIIISSLTFSTISVCICLQPSLSIVIICLFLSLLFGSAVVIIVNLPGIKTLKLTPEVLVGIYNGTYTLWSDPDLKSLNPDLDLPMKHIRVVVRSDTSGTTEIFTRALSAFDTKWRDTFGWFR